MDFNKFSVFHCLENIKLPSHEYISEISNVASEIEENEITDYRTAASNGYAGSLLELNDLPTVIVPDIHGRPEFLRNILKFKLPSDFCEPSDLSGNQHCSPVTVEEALQQKKINMICVGDAIHTELTMERWHCIELEFEENRHTGVFMKKEMEECLSVLCGIMGLKILYPENFHFLKGNHENILNETVGGDFAFCKYSDEGQMVRDFITDYYGEDVLYLISCWEKALPLIASGKNYVVSHAEPRAAFSRTELVDARFYGNVVNGLIWTRNGDVQDDTAQVIINELLPADERANAFYFAGHRPVREKYALRQNGKLVQFHNPGRENIALVPNNRIFNPEKDIVGVDHE